MPSLPWRNVRACATRDCGCVNMCDTPVRVPRTGIYTAQRLRRALQPVTPELHKYEVNTHTDASTEYIALANVPLYRDNRTCMRQELSPLYRALYYTITKNYNLDREYRDCIKSRRDKIGITRHIMMHQVLYNVHVTLFIGQLHNI